MGGILRIVYFYVYYQVITDAKSKNIPLAFSIHPCIILQERNNNQQCTPANVHVKSLYTMHTLYNHPTELTYDDEPDGFKKNYVHSKLIITPQIRCAYNFGNGILRFHQETQYETTGATTITTSMSSSTDQFYRFIHKCVCASHHYYHAWIHMLPWLQS